MSETINSVTLNSVKNESIASLNHFNVSGAMLFKMQEYWISQQCNFVTEASITKRRLRSSQRRKIDMFSFEHFATNII